MAASTKQIPFGRALAVSTQVSNASGSDDRAAGSTITADPALDFLDNFR
jgi:hypothetical protein